MSDRFFLRTNTASATQIVEHLRACDDLFSPPLHNRKNIDEYAKKLFNFAHRFEAWNENHLIGIIAAYFDSSDKGISYISNVSVLSEWQGKGIASSLMESLKQHAVKRGVSTVRLEVNQSSSAAIGLYLKHGFHACSDDQRFMVLDLNCEGELDAQAT